MSYDLLLKGGVLIDPAQKVHTPRDIAFAEGRVAWVGEGLAPSEAKDVMDCEGLLVVPGMIDLHVHVFWGVSHYGIEADPNCISRGVTTAVDAGSAGADTFPGFRKYVMEANATRLLALINISTQGLLTPDIGELEDPRYASVERTVEMIKEHRDVILAVKVRLTKHSVASERSGLRPLQMAREAADAVGLPLMVHPQDAWCDSIDDILAVMGREDILTHCFHGLSCGILDAKGHVRPSVRDAADRGVIFDVGHGRSSFKWDVAERAIAQGFKPHTISSDLHVYNVDGPVHDLATTVSKFIHLGLSIDEALEKVTATPARILHRSDNLGTLKVGAQGDAAVLQQGEGRVALFDTHKQKRLCKGRLIPRAVVRSGKRYIPPGGQKCRVG